METRTSFADRCALRRSAAAIPGAREVIVGDSGHMLFVEQPQAFHDEVADFLVRLES